MNPTNNSFIFTDGLYITLSECRNRNNTFFESTYFDFFLLNINDPFAYNIISQGNGDLSLTIVSENGDVALYGNQILSREEFSKLSFEIYRNPTSDVLMVSPTQGSGILEIKVFDISGNLLNIENIDSGKNSVLEVSNLSSGIYFLHIKDDRRKLSVKKFVKINRFTS